MQKAVDFSEHPHHLSNKRLSSVGLSTLPPWKLSDTFLLLGLSPFLRRIPRGNSSLSLTMLQVLPIWLPFSTNTNTSFYSATRLPHPYIRELSYIELLHDPI